MKALTPAQERELARRDRYAKQGINYDKATRRFLEQHDQEDSTPTVKQLPAAIDLLLHESDSESP